MDAKAFGIAVVGDVHAEWARLNMLIESMKPSMILQCGDFGYWPRAEPEYDISNIKNGSCKIYFCDGNHENHWELVNLVSNEIKENVFYMKRGSVLELPDGRRVLFIGGAKSIDKNARKFGVDWYREETISYSDVENLPDDDIDIVVSHTCPKEFRKSFNNTLFKSEIYKDPSEDALSYVLERYKPEKWFFGHFHYSIRGKYKWCEWQMLDHILRQKGALVWI